ncbi:gamma-glutamylcyclotransferase [Rhizobium sp. PP-F2F-G48]|uniref:gamma-glutamylcyclotransferase n=1 Tax=Rhizobium sp. PP-F2F-G48 TaxID=2135651 RepID=UPI001FDF8021|nr:gamma-glutamylcyclotransferase [Rhizobium sp. PP-F2F-G48]
MSETPAAAPPSLQTRSGARQRQMSLTPELVALCYRDEPDPGLDARLTPMEDEDYRALARDLDAQSGGAPLWVFAYGSLIWKPEFDPVESRRATAYGWHRAFSLKIDRWRGSRAAPGLMMALERGGRCDGVIYRLADGDRIAQIERLLRRELSSRETISTVRWMPVRTPEGPVSEGPANTNTNTNTNVNVLVLGFWLGSTGHDAVARLPLEEVARILARACGHVGSGAEYLYNTVLHLEAAGIHDRNLWRLQALVAEEIRSLYAQDGASTPLTGEAKAALQATPAIKVGAEKACDPV